MATLNVPVTKGKTTIEIDTEKLPDNVYQEALLQGLKVLANRGASKITKETYPDEDEMKAAAVAKAQEQVEALYEGKVRITGQKKAAGASGAVMTEARRLAKNLVKDGIKAAGMKVSHVESSVITKAANELLNSEQGPGLIEQAKANLEERSKVKLGIDIKSLVHESPKLKAKAEERKAKAKETLSAKQAGKVKPRARAEANV